MASRKSKKAPDVLSAAYLERASGKVSISIIISCASKKMKKMTMHQCLALDWMHGYGVQISLRRLH